MDGKSEEELFKELLNLYKLQEAVEKIVTGAALSGSFVLTEAMVRGLHRIGMDSLLPSAGSYRNIEVSITNCAHRPPSWIEVEAMMGSMCRYVNENWATRDLIHLSSFVLWRLCWVHPFANGNGRTARAVSYMVMCARYGKLLPGKISVVAQIVANRQPYYAALREADEIYASTNSIDSAMMPLEALMSALLKNQLLDSLQKV